MFFTHISLTPAPVSFGCFDNTLRNGVSLVAKVRRKQGDKELVKRNRRQTFHHSSCGTAGTAPPAVISYPGEKQTSEEYTGMQG